MSLDARGLFDAVMSHAMASGYPQQTQGHEPKNAPGNGITIAVWVQDIRPVALQSGLAATSARVEFNVRVYSNMLQEPQDGIDPEVISVVDALMNAYNGDFTLGGSVSSVDVFGKLGEQLGARAGYQNIGGQMMRVMTVLLPLIINDVWVQAP